MKKEIESTYDSTLSYYKKEITLIENETDSLILLKNLLVSCFIIHNSIEN